MLRLLTILLLLTGCKAIEQAKDRKALGRVLSSPDMIAQVGKVLPPCTNDTVTKTVQDTVLWLETDTTHVIIGDTVYSTITETKTVEKIVTQTKYITDNKALNAQRDSTDKYKGIAIQVSKDFAKAVQDAKDAKGSANTWRLYFIILCLVVIIAVGVYVYMKFKKPI